jgi:hypothetical protein
MRTIYKYPLERGVTRLDVPPGSTLVSVDIQNGEPIGWVMHDRERLQAKEREAIIVTIARTGGDIPRECGSYLSTFFEHGGLYVWHAFAHYEGPVNG